MSFQSALEMVCNFRLVTIQDQSGLLYAALTKFRNASQFMTSSSFDLAVKNLLLLLLPIYVLYISDSKQSKIVVVRLCRISPVRSGNKNQWHFGFHLTTADRPTF